MVAYVSPRKHRLAPNLRMGIRAFGCRCSCFAVCKKKHGFRFKMTSTPTFENAEQAESYIRSLKPFWDDVPNMIPITVKRVSSNPDERNPWRAEVPLLKIWAAGSTEREAIGDLIACHYDLFLGRTKDLKSPVYNVPKETVFEMYIEHFNIISCADYFTPDEQEVLQALRARKTALSRAYDIMYSRK